MTTEAWAEATHYEAAQTGDLVAALEAAAALVQEEARVKAALVAMAEQLRTAAQAEAKTLIGRFGIEGAKRIAREVDALAKVHDGVRR